MFDIEKSQLMPKPLTERPLSEHQQTLYRVERQLELSSKKLGPARLKRVKEHLATVREELQNAEVGKR